MKDMFIVTAKFDTEASNDVVVKPFHSYAKALEFAYQQKQEFLKQIMGDGLVDEEWTYEQYHIEQYFYHGVSALNSTETISIRVEEATFGDEPQSNLMANVQKRLDTVFEELQEKNELLRNSDLYCSDPDEFAKTDEEANRLDGRLEELVWFKYKLQEANGDVAQPPVLKLGKSTVTIDMKTNTVIE